LSKIGPKVKNKIMKLLKKFPEVEELELEELAKGFGLKIKK
jgi:hypothetical protein